MGKVDCSDGSLSNYRATSNFTVPGKVAYQIHENGSSDIVIIGGIENPTNSYVNVFLFFTIYR